MKGDFEQAAWTINAGLQSITTGDWHLGVSSSIVLNTATCEGVEEALKVIKKLINKISKFIVNNEILKLLFRNG